MAANVIVIFCTILVIGAIAFVVLSEDRTDDEGGSTDKDSDDKLNKK